MTKYFNSDHESLLAASKAISGHEPNTLTTDERIDIVRQLWDISKRLHAIEVDKIGQRYIQAIGAASSPRAWCYACASNGMGACHCG